MKSYTVIEITKSYRNGKNTILKLVECDSTSTEMLEDIARETCENDDAGQIYGYTYKWKVIKDKQLIEEVVAKRLGEIDSKIINYQVQRVLLAKAFPDVAKNI